MLPDVAFNDQEEEADEASRNEEPLRNPKPRELQYMVLCLRGVAQRGRAQDHGGAPETN